LRVYRAETAPLVDYFRKRGVLRNIDGVGSVDEIAARIDAALQAEAAA
jgi:adenylate kinase